jgi:hypothetical protein
MGNSQQREYRYSPNRRVTLCPDHPGCLMHRCGRWLCQAGFHVPTNQRGQPRRYCSPACRVAEHRRLRT